MGVAAVASVVGAVAPVPGHAVFLLLVQLALLLVVARVGALAARVLGLPAVVGELAAGLVLGPTVFGHFAPGAFAAVFPQISEQFHLLETVGLLGMVLLLLLTGLETDLKLLRNLGRAAFVASALGMLVPFLLGFGLGVWMPDRYLAEPSQRLLFAGFLATAMSISAMPVIAKILIDLDLTRRNLGLVILSAGVVDDTAGWLVLSLIAGAAARGGAIQLGALGATIGLMLLYLVLMVVLAYPVLRVLLRLMGRSATTDTELVTVVAFTLLSAAATEWIGIHAVFGAFIAGAALRQVPHLRGETVHRLEGFVLSILAPVFFGTVGLKVDLWTLAGGGGAAMLGIVLGIACLGKLVGCTAGGLWGGLGFWEAFSIAVAMNARGAMELVVASIGLSLGILNQQMFSIIVVVAIVTSFMAPVALRLTTRLVRVTKDEEQRLLEEKSRGVFSPGNWRALVPTAGGPNALVATRIACELTSRTSDPVHVVHVKGRDTIRARLTRALGRARMVGDIEPHLADLRRIAGPRPLRVRQVASAAPAQAVLEEASRGFDLIVAGASGGAQKLGGPMLVDLVNGAPCHVVVIKAGGPNRTTRRIFVPIDGSLVSRTAAELALHYAEMVGAELTLGLLSDRRPPAVSQVDSLPDTPSPPTVPAAPIPESYPSVPFSSSPRVTGPHAPESEKAPEEELWRISPVFRVSKLRPLVIRIDYDPGLGAVAQVIEDGGYDFVVLGAENRAIRHRLFFGHENERIIDLATVTTAIVIPRPGLAASSSAGFR